MRLYILFLIIFLAGCSEYIEPETIVESRTELVAENYTETIFDNSSEAIDEPVLKEVAIEEKAVK